MHEITIICSTFSSSLEGVGEISCETGIHLIGKESKHAPILVLKIAYLVLVSASVSKYNKVRSKELELS